MTHWLEGGTGPVGRFLHVWTGWICKAPYLVLFVAGVVTLGSALYTARHLGMNTDTTDMISDDLPWRGRFLELRREFPQFSGTLLIVIDGDTALLAEQAAASLGAALAAEETALGRLFDPAGSDFFADNGLLYLDTGKLEELADRLALVQPFIGRLARDPSLNAFLELVGDAAGHDGDATGLEEILNPLARTMGAVAQGHDASLPWRDLTGLAPPGAAATRRVLVLQPPLEFDRLLPARQIVARIRALAQSLRLDDAHGVTVRLTGPVALQYEELRSVSRGAGLTGGLALATVALVLWWALRAWRLVAACLVTLLAGLIGTAGFAAAAIGHLNLISIAFAVLYIGLGIDFAIHLCLRYRELLGAGLAAVSALRTAASDVGTSLLLCALTTSIGFFAFFPTAFSGVAELGLISGTGMYISLLASLSLLPAILVLMPAPTVLPARHLRAQSLGWPRRHRGLILASAGFLALAAAVLVPDAHFDANPLNLREQDTESVRTFRDLLAASDSAPLTLSVLLDERASLRSLATRLASEPMVASTASLEDWVPAEQTQRLAILDDLRFLLGPDLAAQAGPTAAPDPDALLRLEEALEPLATGNSASAESAAEALHATRDFRTLLAAGDAAQRSAMLLRLEKALVGTLPGELERLSRALTAGPVSEETLPEDLRARWRSPSGRLRLEIVPAVDLSDEAAARLFISRVSAIAPDATGVPVMQLGAGDAVIGAFRQALVTALIVVGLLLLLILRDLRGVLLVLMPVVLAGLFTTALSVVADVSFNFANVIALPLLLGVGVDNGIHMVHRMKAAPPADGRLLGTSTARGVFFSALTTIASFGNLALSPHPGTASMGLLLTTGMLLIVACTLIILPALLEEAPVPV